MGQFSKKFDDLTFSDNYIFCKVLKDSQLCRELLEILLKIKIQKIEYLNTEQEIINLYESKGIRMDVYIKDSNRIIDLEMQTGNYDNLILRSRYYQSAADIDSCPRRTQYDRLKESFIIFICKDDPFGFGLPCYTKQSKFIELPEISYNDKTHNVFYNSSAYDKVSDSELKAVLKFIYEASAESDFTKKLQVSVSSAKSKGFMRDEYMYFQDILEDEKEQARAAGHAEGLAAGHAEGMAEGRKKTVILHAKKMLEKSFSIKDISEITGLSEAEIKKI